MEPRHGHGLFLHIMVCVLLVPTIINISDGQISDVKLELKQYYEHKVVKENNEAASNFLNKKVDNHNLIRVYSHTLKNRTALRMKGNDAQQNRPRFVSKKYRSKGVNSKHNDQKLNNTRIANSSLGHAVMEHSLSITRTKKTFLNNGQNQFRRRRQYHHFKKTRSKRQRKLRRRYQTIKAYYDTIQNNTYKTVYSTRYNGFERGKYHSPRRNQKKMGSKPKDIRTKEYFKQYQKRPRRFKVTGAKRYLKRMRNQKSKRKKTGNSNHAAEQKNVQHSHVTKPTNQTHHSSTAAEDRVNRDSCDRYDVNGCSIPFGEPFFYKHLFTKSCYRHDICYHCGVQYSIKRKTCDNTFKDNMWIACISKYGNRNDVITDPDKQLVVEAVEGLLIKFNAILRQEMATTKTLYYRNKEKNIEIFHNHALFIQRKVLKQWVGLLRKRIESKTKSNKRYNSQHDAFVSDLKSENRFHHFQNESRDTDGNIIYYENNLTTDICNDVLNDASYNPIKSSGFVELSCEEVHLLTCHFVSYLYFFAVRTFGGSSYHNKPEFYCGQSFVPKCLPPIPHQPFS